MSTQAGDGERPDRDEVKERSAQARLVAREAGGTWLAHVAGMGLRYGGMLFTTHILGPALYGAYMLSITLTSIAGVVSLLGLAQGVLPFLSRARSRGGMDEVRAVVRASLLLVLCTSLLIGTALCIAAPWLGEAVFEKTDLAGMLRPLSLLVVLGGLTTMLFFLLQGFMAVKERAWIELVLVTAVTGAGLALAWWAGWGVPGVIAAALAGPLAGGLAGAALLARKAPGAFLPAAPSAPLPFGPLLGYSWPLLGTSMLSFLLLWSDILLMGFFRDAREVGIYGACARLAPVVIMVHESLRPVFTARLSDLYVEKDWKGIRHLYLLTARWAMWPGLVSAGALILWAPEVLRLFGADFAAGASALAVLCAGKAFVSCTGMSGMVFGVTGRAKIHLLNMILLVGLNILLNLLLIPRHGAPGAAAATCISLVVIRILQGVQIWFIFRIPSWNRRLLIPLLGTALLAGIAYPFRQGIPGAAGWTLPLALYLLACAALFLFKGIGEDDRAVWRALRNRRGSGITPR